jgi:hypothetical protein
VDQPAEEIRGFIDHAAREIGRLPILLADPSNHPVNLELHLTLTINDAALAAFNKEAKRAYRKNGKRHLW